MSEIIGIDLGTNSIGWAIRDTTCKDNQIIDSGVLTFDKGVASEKGNEFPKVQKRTESRGKRRNYQAEKYRKWELLNFLIDKKMCPLTKDELEKWRKYEKGQKREYPQSEAFINWLRFDFNGDGKPDFHLFDKSKHESYYIFRTCAVDINFKKVFDSNPHVLGRVLYQLVQRRGFKGRDEEEAKTMLQGSEKAGTPGRNQIADYIEKHKTLGAALYHFQKENGGRIRQRYNLRKDYENELKEICNIHNFDESDYQKLWKAIIWQRPLRTQKGLIGKCIYEKNKRRVSVNHPLYEEYRTWVFINNLKVEPPFNIKKEEYLRENIYPLFYRASNFEVSNIIKQLNRDGAQMKANFHPKTKVVPAKLLNSLQDTLGDNWKEEYNWNNINERESQPQKKTNDGYNYEDIWHVLNTFDGQENLKNFALEKLNLDEDKAEKFSKIKLNQGYATLSLSAIKKMLPYLRKGFLYNQAVYLANLYKVLGTENISDDLINSFAKEVAKIIEQNKEQKKLNNIVNNLIQDELNDKNRYSIEIDRPLDDEEKRLVLSKVIEVIGHVTWKTFDEDKKSEYLEYVSRKFKEFLKKSVLSKHNVFIEQPRLHDQIFKFIQESYDVPDTNKKHLWHPSEQESYKPAEEYYKFTLKNKDVYISDSNLTAFKRNNTQAENQLLSLKLLGNPEPISKGFKNPMALKSLHRLKQLLNHLLKIGKINEDTRVVVEIARELNDKNKRKALENWNKKREAENESYRKIIREINDVSKTNFDENDRILLKKIRLWKEQNMKCPYTGKTINKSDVFNGNLYDLEHTIPASISFDSELKNLTLSDTDYNRNIKKRLFPAQLPDYDKVLQNIESIFGKLTETKKTIKGKKVTTFSCEKITQLELQFEDWKNKSAYTSSKDYKDFCIQKYQEIKLELDYWRAKLKTFTIDEYKAGWRNSQLRDTQIITKYALPYLKTVFKKVSVEKGTVVDSFKKIYNVKLPFEKKDRTKHSHHAIDAAILTLIPPFYDRDKILAEYNEHKDKKTGEVYHETPKDWSDFNASKILSIENEILINNLSESKTTLQTFKKVRKRGEIVWKDKEKQNPLMAKGDTVRGQLHGESLYGAIKQPQRDQNGKILFDDENKMILHDEIFVVLRKDLVYKKDANSPGFKSLDDIEKVIVDRPLFEMIKKQVDAAPDFKTAMTNGVYMLNKEGKPVNKIRRIRCKERIKYDSTVKVHKHHFSSDKEYKQKTLAVNGENALCLFYKNDKGKAINILSISEVAELKFKNDKMFFNEPHYNQIEKGKGKKKELLPLYAVLRSGQKVLFFNNSIEELIELHKDGNKEELSKRMFKMYQFEGDTNRIKFRHHLAAGIDTELKKKNKEFSYYKFDENQVFLRLTQKEWNFAIDGVDFEIKMDGSIEFKKL